MKNGARVKRACINERKKTSKLCGIRSHDLWISSRVYFLTLFNQHRHLRKLILPQNSQDVEQPPADNHQPDQPPLI